METAKQPELPIPLPERNLPTLADLSGDLELAFKNDDLNILLNSPVPASWVKQHPMVRIKVPDGNGGEMSIPLPYVPVKKVKMVFKRIFQKPKWEIKNVGQILNAIYVTGTLSAPNPITGEWESQDGCGAAPIQMDKGATQGDLTAIKSNAIQIALPAAESYAWKNAAEKFGDIFGGNLIDLDNAGYKPMFDEKTREMYNPENDKGAA